MSLTQTYSLDEFNNIKCKLDFAISSFASRAGKKKLFNVGTGDMCRLKTAISYRWVLNEWEQNPNGTTTGYINRITQSQFVNLINKIKVFLA